MFCMQSTRIEIFRPRHPEPNIILYIIKYGFNKTPGFFDLLLKGNGILRKSSFGILRAVLSKLYSDAGGANLETVLYIKQSLLHAFSSEI